MTKVVCVVELQRTYDIDESKLVFNDEEDRQESLELAAVKRLEKEIGKDFDIGFTEVLDR